MAPGGPAPEPPTTAALFLGFLSIGIIGFGGVLPWARRMMVEQRRWLTPAEFTDLLGLCQFLPGPNIVNLAVALGSRFRGLPGAIGYAASKAGTMVLAESLYADLRKSGITVQLANPGFIRTRLTAKNDFAMPFIMEPEAAADIMFRHMQSGRFKVSFPTLFSWLFRGGQLQPDWLYYRMFPPKP